MSSIAPCNVCGGVDYEKQSGYYICRNCDTQSQDIQEQSFEYNIDAPHFVSVNDEKEEVVSQKVDKERKLTSWECYNIVLKGLVDELIKLGAQPELRKVAFQLWSFYLQREQVAFFSKTDEKLPSLPSTFKNKDIEVLYGIKNFRNMYFKDMQKMSSYKVRRRKVKLTNEPIIESSESDSDDSVSSNYSTKGLHQKQRKLAVSTLMNDTSVNETSNSETLNTIGNKENKNKEVALAFKESARMSMKELMEQFEKVKRRYGDNIPSNKQAWFANRIYCRKKYIDPCRISLNINTVMIILRVALLHIEDTIQWADLFRWASEGRLSFYRVAKFLPENASIRHSDLNPSTRANLIHIEMRRMMLLLNMKDIPSPDLFVLVERYAYELCLPNEFIKFTKKVMACFPPQMDHAYFENRTFPDYECRAMGYLLFIFKLLFSVDDVTEEKQAKFAEAVNKCNKETPLEDVPPLFSWSSWVRYIECRKVLLCKYDVSMSRLYDCDTQTTDDVFLNYWKKTSPDPCFTIPNQRINLDLTMQLKVAAKRLQNKHAPYVKMENGGNIDFPASITPFRTYTEHLIVNHRELLSERCYQILSNDFSSHSIKYLLDHDWAIAIGNKCDLHVKPVFDAAIKNRKKYEEPASNIPHTSKCKIIPAHIATRVQIIDDRKKKGEGLARHTLEEYEPGFELFDLNGIKEEKCQFFEVHYPSKNYWLFHDMDRRIYSEKLNKYARNNFSVSFLWLLKECSRIIRCELKDLYAELMHIEFAYTCLFSDDNEYSEEAPLAVYANEW